MAEAMDAVELIEEMALERQVAFLAARSPDDWHRYADMYNWDVRLEPLYWIVSQPECDRATATMLFWKGEPTGYDWWECEEKLGDSSYAVEPLLQHIARRFNAGTYTRAEIAYDFLQAGGGGLNAEYDEMVRKGRLDDFELLVEQQDDCDPAVRVHPDLMVLHLPGRKVGGFADKDEFYDLLPSEEDITDEEVEAEAARRGITLVR